MCLPSCRKSTNTMRLLPCGCSRSLVNRQLAGRDGLSRLGSYYERQGKLPQAREVLERAEQAGPPSVEILSELARVAYQQHDREGALDIWPMRAILTRKMRASISSSE